MWFQNFCVCFEWFIMYPMYTGWSTLLTITYFELNTMSKDVDEACFLESVI